jgi:glycolate oxidase FAD binding subunit
VNLTELQERVREARAAGGALAICGAGSKPWMPRYLSGREKLSLRQYSGIISHDPGELVVTVKAGTPLAELEAALAERGQMLPMEAPDFNGGSTIGGAVALGWAGSRSVFAGGVRDSVLGLRMINGLGEDLRFGGRVMKNVAGFDVSRLMVGSCGELGIITELSLRLLPRPPGEITLQWTCPDLDTSRQQVADWLGLGYPVSGASFVEGKLLARFSGRAVMLDEIARDTGGEPADSAWWGELKQLRLPLFHHGWGDEKLFDCNGEVCWTAHTRRRGGHPPVSLAEGPGGRGHSPGHERLHRRIAEAFDPGGVFRPAAGRGTGEAA